MSMSELLKAVWDFDISICPDCGHSSMKQLGRCYAPSWSSWLLILFWKSLPTGGFESMSCNVLHHKNQRVFSWFLIIFDDFGHLGTIQSPYKNWLKYRDWVQYERITFRAVPIYCRTALFVNSESDTFLMNYTRGNLICNCFPFFLFILKIGILNICSKKVLPKWQYPTFKKIYFLFLNFNFTAPMPASALPASA